MNRRISTVVYFQSRPLISRSHLHNISNCGIQVIPDHEKPQKSQTLFTLYLFNENELNINICIKYSRSVFNKLIETKKINNKAFNKPLKYIKYQTLLLTVHLLVTMILFPGINCWESHAVYNSPCSDEAWKWDLQQQYVLNTT